MRVCRRARVTATAVSMGLSLSGLGLLPGTTIDDRPAAAAVPAAFVAQGPSPVTGGQVENVTPNNEVAGAVHTVVAHPSDPKTLWVGTVDGGIWRTRNANTASPDWTPLIDQSPSLAIDAMELDPTVASNTVLVAGHGIRSAHFGAGPSLLPGILRTTNAGNTWASLGQADLTGQNISGVAPRGATIVVSSRTGSGNGGIYRSTDTGASFTQISGAPGTGLPTGLIFDMVGDPSNNARLYAAGAIGLFRSDDTGATWTNVTDTVVGPAIIPGTTNNLEMAVHNSMGNNVVYAGVINNGQLGGLFRSTNQGGAWVAMDIPLTNEGMGPVGLQPRAKPGGQGGVHFSIVADRTSPTLVYLGGDRQPNSAMGFPNPNSVGATTFSGRLFKCDAGAALTQQCVAGVMGSAGGPLTHNGTAGGSAPHADSREMVFDANGDIIEVDDGGVYRQTNPATTNGDWQSLNGDLQISENISCEYDNVSDVIVCGTQDNGSQEQDSGGSTGWHIISAGDGGFVAVDDSGVNSVRYTSSNNLGGFQKRSCDNANTCAVLADPTFVVAGTGGQTIFQVEVDGAMPPNSTLPLYTPVVMNTIDPDRFVITGNAAVYESLDQMDNLTVVANPPNGTNRVALPEDRVAYGGRQGGVDNPDVLWFGDQTSTLFLRTGPGPMSVPAPVPGWTFGRPAEMVLDPEDWTTAFVAANSATIYHTDDAGLSFTDITGSLATLAPNAQILDLEVVPVPAQNTYVLLAGTDTGVFMTNPAGLGSWVELGAATLPNTLANVVKYDAVDDVLLVGTLGRGTWLAEDFAADILPVADLLVFKSDSPDPVIAGEELFYTVTVVNDGADTAFDVVVTDDLPDEVLYLSDTGDCTFDAVENQLSCPLGDIPAGKSASFTIKTRVRSDAVIAETDGTLLIENRATAGAASLEGDPSDNVAVARTYVQERADLRVTKVCKPDGVLRAGEIGTCTMYVDNHGPSAARDVVLRDAVVSDGNFTFGTITPAGPTCDALDIAPLDGIDDTVVCALGALPAASPTEAGRAIVTVEVGAGSDIDINDVADVRSATPDPNSANNQAQGSISVMAVADLGITKTGTPDPVVAGEILTYNFEITNNGPSVAEGVVVEDVLPGEVEILSVSGIGATCNAGVPGNPALPTRCDFGNVNAGGIRVMEIVVRVKPDTLGLIHNDVRVSSETFDDALGNNLATETTTVAAEADLSITKDHSPDEVVAGDQLTYTVVVTNNGPSTAADVTLTEFLPAQTAFVSGVDGKGNPVCALVLPGVATCDLGAIAPGASVTVYVTVLVPADTEADTVLVNEATVASASTPDPDLTNNTAGDEVTVVTAADLWIDMTAKVTWKRKPGRGDPRVAFTITVHNQGGCETDADADGEDLINCGQGGPSDAFDVEVVNKLPFNKKDVKVKKLSASCQYDKKTHTVICHAGRIPAGRSVSFVVETEVDDDIEALDNEAEVTSSTPDPVEANNENEVELVFED